MRIIRELEVRVKQGYRLAFQILLLRTPSLLTETFPRPSQKLGVKKKRIVKIVITAFTVTLWGRPVLFALCFGHR